MHGDVEVRRTTANRFGIVIQGRYRTQDEAIAAARIIARILGVELFVRGLGGRLLRRDSHGNDPKDTPG